MITKFLKTIRTLRKIRIFLTNRTKNHHLHTAIHRSDIVRVDVQQDQELYLLSLSNFRVDSQSMYSLITKVTSQFTDDSLIIIPVEYVSVTNAGDAEADDRKESHFYLNDREANKSVLYLRNNKYTKSGFAKEGVL